MQIGSRKKPNQVGDIRPCSSCSTEITVNSNMIRSAWYVCQPCRNKTKQEWEERNRQKRREWNRQYQKNHPGLNKKKNELYVLLNPEKKKAQSMVRTEIRAKRIVRKNCETCGHAGKVHAHHDDYTKPLDIRWLCSICHANHHVAIRKEYGVKEGV